MACYWVSWGTRFSAMISTVSRALTTTIVARPVRTAATPVGMS
jgi:hypothetical protein